MISKFKALFPMLLLMLSALPVSKADSVYCNDQTGCCTFTIESTHYMGGCAGSYTDCVDWYTICGNQQ